MKVNLEIKEITFKEVEIKFPFYNVEEFEDDFTRMQYFVYTRITENSFLRIKINHGTTEVVDHKTKFKYLNSFYADAIEHQKEYKEDFNDALKLLKQNIKDL